MHFIEMNCFHAWLYQNVTTKYLADLVLNQNENSLFPQEIFKASNNGSLLQEIFGIINQKKYNTVWSEENELYGVN